MMIEERLERLENMMAQLLKMVGNNNTKLQEMEAKMDARLEQVDERFEQVGAKFEELELKNEERHQQIIDKVSLMKVDQDNIW